MSTKVTASMLAPGAAAANLNATSFTLGTLSVSGGVTVGGAQTVEGKLTANGQPNFHASAMNDVATLSLVRALSSCVLNLRTYAMNSASWVSLQTNTVSTGGDNVRRIQGGNVAGSTLALYAGGEDMQRGRVGNNKGSGQFGSTDFTSKFRMFVSMAGVQTRTDFAVDYFAAAFGTHYSLLSANGGVAHVTETNNPAAASYYFGFKIQGGAVTLWTKNGVAAATSSATLATLTDIFDIGQFVLESNGAGTVSLYRNGVLLGSHTGAPNTMINGSSTVIIGYTTTAATFREFILQGVNLTWE